MKQSCIVVRDGDERHQLIASSRDWSLLTGPGFTEGLVFTSVYGIYANFSVAAGIPDNSRVTRRGQELLSAARVLQSGIERNIDLLQFDYSYSFTKGRGRAVGNRSISLRGCAGMLSAQPKGYCWIKLFRSVEGGPSRVAEVIDLRIVGQVETDDCGTLKMHRKKSEVRWPEHLPPLIEFLRSRTTKELVVEHLPHFPT